MNVQAFAWGRIAAVDPQRVREAAALDAPPSGVIAPTLDDEQVSPTPQQAFERRVRFLGERSEEHTSELQSLMRISYAVFCLKKKKTKLINGTITLQQALHTPHR